jgi:hypothetical protein
VRPARSILRADRAIADEADRIAREVHRLGVDYIAYDSVAFACAGAPEAAEQASIYFRAVRQIGSGSLNLAHVTKAENGDQKPLGSTFWHDGARATYFAEAADGGDILNVGLGHRRSADRGGEREELASSQALWRRLSNTLKQARKPMTIAELAEVVEAKKDGRWRSHVPVHRHVPGQLSFVP